MSERRRSLEALLAKREERKTACMTTPVLWDDNLGTPIQRRRAMAREALEACGTCHAKVECWIFAQYHPEIRGIIAGLNRLTVNGRRPVAVDEKETA